MYRVVLPLQRSRLSKMVKVVGDSELSLTLSLETCNYPSPMCTYDLRYALFDSSS